MTDHRLIDKILFDMVNADELKAVVPDTPADEMRLCISSLTSTISWRQREIEGLNRLQIKEREKLAILEAALELHPA